MLTLLFYPKVAQPPVTHTTPPHLAQVLLKRYSGYDQGSRQTRSRQVGSSAEFWKFKIAAFHEGIVLGSYAPKLRPPLPLGSYETEFASPIKSPFLS